MLSIIGYLIASIIFIIIVLLVVNILISKFGKDIDEAMSGNLLKELYKAILNEGRKFLPIKNDSALAIIIIIIMVVLYWLNLKYLIK